MRNWKTAQRRGKSAQPQDVPAMQGASEGPPSRRQFLYAVGAIAGPVAAYDAMIAMGLCPPEASAAPPQLAPGSGCGKRVLVLGAGVAGLTAAYELQRAGYTCRILEAQNRIGGRSLTVRNRSKIVEASSAHGRTEQTCCFDRGLYANLGPARFPYHHRRVIHYCRELQIPLEVFVMSTSANLLQRGNSPSQAMVRRRVQYDLQGYVSELLAKSLRRDCLDDVLSAEETSQLTEWLHRYGDLDPDTHRYLGTTRAGCHTDPDTTVTCTSGPPISLDDLLQGRWWAYGLFAPDEYEWQATLFQPKGGMDQIVALLAEQLQGRISLAAEVQGIEVSDAATTVCWYDRTRGCSYRESADYCVSSIPIPILREIPANFGVDFRRAMDSCSFAETCKIAWQANERFWENDAYRIYGGVSYIDHSIGQLWYPSHDFHSANGTLIGAYNTSGDAIAMGQMDLHSRLQLGREGGARLHAEFANPRTIPDGYGLSIAWHHVPFQGGGWARWSSAASLSKMFAPDRTFYVTGDQVSTLPGWQEGAMMSAAHVVEQINGTRPKTVDGLRELPDVRRLVEGLF